MSDAAGGAPAAAGRRRRPVPLVPAASIAGRALVTVIAIMTFLASLAAGAAVLVAGTSRDWQGSVAREATVQVLPAPGRDVDADVARATAIAARGARRRRRRALRQGPRPEASGTLARRRRSTSVTCRSRASSSCASRPGRTSTRRPCGPRWRRTCPTPRSTTMAPGRDASPPWRTRWSGSPASSACLVLTALGLAVAFATRGVMAGNREIIGVLHFVGAEDRFIAREFQRHFLRLGLQGAGVGGGLAALAFLLANLVTSRLAGAGADEVEALFGTFALGPRGYAAIALIAVGTALATGWMSRTIVFRHLRGLE